MNTSKLRISRHLISLTIGAGLAVGLGAFAADLPHTFQDGEVISAAEINENFVAMRDGINDLVPPGAVMYFDLPSCPTGWSDFANGQGRYPVGMPVAGTLGAVVGDPLGDTEERFAGSHQHGMPHGHGDSLGLNDPGHVHTNPGTQYQDGNGGNRLVHSPVAGGGAPNSYSATTGITITGSVSNFTGNSDPAGHSSIPAPYVQLRVCKKF